MRVIVFGNSDTRGAVVPGPTWPELARRSLEALTGPVELVDRNFVPLGARAASVAARLAEEARGDVLLLPLSEYAFWAETVELQVRRLFGTRAARLFKRAEQRFVRAAARGGPAGAATDSVARGLARRVIGTRAPASVAEVIGTYSEVFRRLARLEELEVVVIAYPAPPAAAHWPRRLRAGRERFIAELRSEADRLRFAWVDGDAVATGAGLGPHETYAPDGVHIGEPMHAPLARAVLAAIRPSLRAALNERGA